MPFSSLPAQHLPRSLASAVNRLLKLDKLEELYGQTRTGSRFAGELLSELDVRIKIAAADLEKIPVTGSVIAVANHPHGILDGVMLTDLLTGIRPDARVLTNRLLGILPELQPLCFFIDPFDNPESAAANSRALRKALAHVRGGGMLLIFPAGEVSHFDIRAGAIRDPEWHPTAARLARITGAKTLPLFIRGANGIPFQVLGMVHPRLRTAALPAEFLNKRGKEVEILAGSVVEPAKLQAFADDHSAIRYLRLRTELLARRRAPDGQSAAAEPPIAAALPASDIAREIEGLPAQCRMEESRDLGVYLAEAQQIPLTLKEIGRLREITFRTAGEGTGEPRDLDRFDPYYLHLFVWNREKQEIVGAYRMGDVQRLLARFGRKGLYTESLFRFRPGFLEEMGPALEMGRSFIRTEYQRQYAPLLLLWKGIGTYCAQRPEYSKLIGAVSVSNQYSRTSRALLARYFAKHALPAEQMAVRPRRPLRLNPIEKWEMEALCSLLPEVDDLSDPIADLEPDGKGLPILVKQYAKLGGRLLAFSVDPQFGNTLDGFVMVDLRRTPVDVLSRYLGRQGAQNFLAWHAASMPRVA